MNLETHYPEIEVDQLMRKIREEVARQQVTIPTTRQEEVSTPEIKAEELTISSRMDTSAIAEHLDYVNGFINTADSRSQVRDELPQKFKQFPYILLRPFQPIALKILNTLFRDQREVNFNLLSALRESLLVNPELLARMEALRSHANQDLQYLRNIIHEVLVYAKGIRQELESLHSRLQSLEQSREDSHSRLQSLEQSREDTRPRLQSLEQSREDSHSRIQSLEQSREDTRPRLQSLEQSREDAQSRLQSLEQSREDAQSRLQSLEQSREASHSWLQNLEQRLEEQKGNASRQFQSIERQIKESDELNFQDKNYLKNDLIQQKRLITMFLEEARKRLPEPFSQEQLQAFSNEFNHSLDAFYLSFEDRFRGNRDLIHQRLEVYLPVLEKAQIAPSDSLIVDLGCGRGEWLELLKENGYRAIGVDLNKAIIEQCHSRGLPDVIEADVIDYLKSLPDASVAVVTGFHIIEHLPFENLVKLLEETLRVLRHRGLAIFETPNPSNVLVGSCNFYFDPTHRNPLPSLMVKFLVEYCGFSQVEILNLNPRDGLKVTENPELSELTQEFNQYFYSAMDYAVIGYKLVE